MQVGWYVHHSGAGHLTRATVVGSVLAGRGHEVTLIGSRLGDAGPQFGRVELPMDDEGVDPHRDDVAAGGRLHWVPLRHTGLRARGAAIAAWVERVRPDVLVVDVSVEVTMLARLLGVPVVVVAQPGERDDEPHRLAYDVAAAVLAPWPSGWRGRLAPHLGEARAEVVEVGGISRWAAGVSRLVPRTSTGVREGSSTGVREGSSTGVGEGSSTGVREGSSTGVGEGAVLSGRGGFAVEGLADRITGSVPQLDWQVLDGRTWVDDPASLIASAEVVVLHAGQNAVADVAALDRPALVLPQPRPFGEQEQMAGALAAAGMARVVPSEKQADPGTDWAAEIEGARRARTAWARWGTDVAAERAADVVEQVARG